MTTEMVLQRYLATERGEKRRVLYDMRLRAYWLACFWRFEPSCAVDSLASFSSAAA